MQKGLFITFEGGEGTGKSTQIRLLAEYLEKAGHSVVLTREPGGSTGAEEIRSLLLKGTTDKWDKMTEILLFTAARRDHLIKKIWPALEQGSVVLSDRFADSTLAYQGYGYGYDAETVKNIQTLYQLIAKDFKPDLTFVLDIDPIIGLKRSLDRSGNTEVRFEGMDIQFHKNLREAFLTMAKQEPTRYRVINAAQSIERVHQDIIQAYQEKTRC